MDIGNWAYVEHMAAELGTIFKAATMDLVSVMTGARCLVSGWGFILTVLCPI